jgi:orotidine-5'-phosphate decarboxylase
LTQAENLAPSNPTTFNEMLAQAWRRELFLCVGLDSDFSALPPTLTKRYPNVEDAIFEFNRQIIDATAAFVCAFKPNLAFYEQSGPPGMVALKRTCDYIRKQPGSAIPIILDAKRGDIASTNKGYAASFFDYYQADAVTVQPYLGREALEPFLERADKGVIVLCRTSNSGSAEIQNLLISPLGNGPAGAPSHQPLQSDVTEALYLKVARLAASAWNYNRNVSLVAGATYPAELKLIRQTAPNLPLLVPGIGAQGGDISTVMQNGLNAEQQGLIISSSRSIIFASNGPDFAAAAHQEAKKLAEQIRQALK